MDNSFASSSNTTRWGWCPRTGKGQQLMVNEAVLGKVKKNVMEISMSGLTPPQKKKKLWSLVGIF